YDFTESNDDGLSGNRQLASIEVSIDSNPVYSLNFIPAGDSLDISLTADPQHNVKAEFYDNINRKYYQASNAVDSLMFVEKVYNDLGENYPFASSDFIQEVQERVQHTQERIAKIINTSCPIQKALISVKHDASKLLASKPDTSIQYNEFRDAFPFEAFDTVIWKSPYYKAWMDAWLKYGSQDLKNAVDLVYGSEQIIPEKASSVVGQYIWDQMNAKGRFDVMVHLDTTWLAGCSDIKDVDVMKRIEGYKRMAPGKKAPNINWEEDGRKMDLYSIEADTIIVVFWSDQCSHCEEKLPAMHEALSSRTDITVVAVAVDTDDSSIQIGKTYMPDWHHVWAKKGWKDELVEQYNIFGTPEMYLLNRHYIILQKQTEYPG
ncbi:MAG: thioredoxin family protein, partial [Bacteroidales bacterium]